jgi:PPOX class probable F420-dependent enzyme
MLGRTRVYPLEHRRTSAPKRVHSPGPGDNSCPLRLLTYARYMTVIPESQFGQHVRERLQTETVVWFTTVGADGTPQPNPVWFLWQENGFLIYNRAEANRLAHIVPRPEVSLNFDGDGQGGDIVVFTGRAVRLDDEPLPHELPAYVEKYGDAMARISGSRENFGAAFPVAVRVDVTRVRGY